MFTFEVCIDTASGLAACVNGGANRIELCSALALGGLTPSAGFMQLASQVSLPVHAMIRPRAGDFCFNTIELDVMCTDIARAAEVGLAGVVLGVANNDGTLNIKAMEQLCIAAGSIEKTLHRVIDTLNDPLLALDQAIDMGFDNVLTSGGKPNVEQGIELLAKLNDRAAGKINIMAGAGLTPSLVPQIYRQTGIQSFHASCRQPKSSQANLVTLGFASPDTDEISENLIRQFAGQLKSLHA